MLWSASGFLYGHFIAARGDQSEFSIYLITNRHVFDQETEMVVRFNPLGSDPAQEFDLPLVDGSGRRLWLAHPDPDIDAAVIGINARHLEKRKIQFSYFRSHQNVLDRKGATDKGLSEGDGAYILGFPMGIVGGDRSYVMVRQGALARVRDWLAGSAKEFLVDATIFPGNSGGPVVNRPENTAISGTKQQTAAYLIGIVKSYVPYTDIAVSQQTGRPRVIFEENSGLAAVVPMEYVIEVIQTHRATLGPPPPAEDPSVAPEESPNEESGEEASPDAGPASKAGPPDSATSDHQMYETQPVTPSDLARGQIRIPKATKPLFPRERAEVSLKLRGVAMLVRYDPRDGPDRGRSGVLRVKKAVLGDLVQPRQRLRVAVSEGVFNLE